MAVALMVCSISKLPSRKAPQIPKLSILSKISKLTFLKTLAKSSLPIIAITAATSPLPALNVNTEKAVLFNFNLTHPAIAVEFLLLMVALDKLYFTSLGKFMDKPDTEIKGKLGDMKDTSIKVNQLELRAVAVMKAARAEIAAVLHKMEKEKSTYCQQFKKRKAILTTNLERPLSIFCNGKYRSLLSEEEMAGLKGMFKMIEIRGQIMYEELKAGLESVGANIKDFEYML